MQSSFVRLEPWPHPAQRTRAPRARARAAAALLAALAWPSTPAQASQFTLAVPGESFASVRDVDGDGIRDLIVGVPAQNRARMYSGAHGAWIADFPAPAGSLEFGRALAVLRDLDQDGYEDLAIGDPGSGDGIVHVYSGRPTAGSFALLQSFGPFSSAGACALPLRFGSALCVVGDLDSDGILELAIGAPSWSSAAGGCSPQGEVEIVSVRAAAVALAAVLSEPGLRMYGHSLAGLGDLDADGLPDLAVGAPDDMFAAQTARVLCYSGADVLAGQALPLARIQFPNASNAFGWAIADVGDIDLDGLHDLVVGSPNFNTAIPASSFCAYSGALIAQAAGGGVTPYGVFSFTAVGKALGVSVSALGDYDHDGRQDFLVGAGSAYNTTGGAVYIVRGSNLSVIQTLTNPGSARFGEFVGPTRIRSGGVPGCFLADPSSGTVLVR